MRRPALGVLLASALLLATPLVTTLAAPPRVEDVSPTQPSRVLDTRIGVGAPARQLTAGVDLSVDVQAPPGATAVMVNLTAVDAVASGWLKAWPCDEQRPATSSLNYEPGIVAANAAIVRLASGRICLGSLVSVDVVADVTGWFFGTSDFTASSPNRLLDTRVTGNPLQPGEERRLHVAGTPGTSSGATIAALNITVDRPSRAGWVVAYPCGQPTNASTLNFGAGEIVANFTLVGLSAGDVCLKSLQATEIVVDSFGWSTGAGKLKVQSPTRLLDTRDSSWGLGPSPTGNALHLRVAGRGGVPLTADAALLTVTVANPVGSGYVTVWPCDQPFPVASTINTFPGGLRSNLILVKLSVVQGEACLQYMASNRTATDLIVDAVGWITGTSARSPDSPCSIAGAAFCETFDFAKNGGTRTGDLDPVLWGVSRVGNINPSQGSLNDVSQVSITGCGSSAWAKAPADVRICGGQLFEAVNDGGGVVNLDTYPKQPFSFEGRTGRVTFDVSADSEGSHAAWPEFLITDKPVPGARVSISGGTPAAAVNEIGFSLDGCSAGPSGTVTGVGTVFVTRNGVYSEPSFTGVGCVTKGSARAMNHFEVRVSKDRLEVWGTDAGGSTLKQLAVADNLGLTFERGLVWLNDVHYNARKSIEPCECGTQWNHTFVWDNLGFDGPKTYRDLGFDVPDANVPGQPAPEGDATQRAGFQIGRGPTTLTVPGVFRKQTPTGALVVFNTYSFAETVPSVSVNGNPAIAAPRPPGFTTYGWYSVAIPVPLDQVHDGDNTLTFTSGDGTTTIANISIILVAGAPVP